MRAFFILILLILATPLRADPLAAAGQPGAILLMRHAIAPGTGDPAGFRLDDCRTQRNLSAAGQAQARAIGARLAEAGITFTQILTSEWCRARDTARLLNLGPVTAFPPANSFFSTRQDEPAQTAAILAHLDALPPQARVLIVTHQVNITALTGIVPQSGETLVVRRSAQGLQLVGRLPPP
ncbi:histidine phosphatase family protein [Pseudorhodobacter sp. MZDSW-24AT]|uniref:histidine phosphatase family protein n=1 Tax=Pseudorhodobacter sp. MZDSW-24AT TaxID=2052957 RepID=UPI000C1E2EDB|nr:histidine phosphatase family protein [Pseudorhodobacter sp. MZDSW-24AT]PJF10848.1 histidine phosphatase family protein [Pseudorhodobacter sp. MZDSW-24AT]